jgi:transposase
MSTSILYHGFGIYGYRYVSSQYQQGTIVFTVEKEEQALRCPSCQGRHVCRRGTQLRWFHTLPIGRKQIYIRLHIPRVFCHDCSVVRQISLGFADPRRTYTKSFERYVVELSRHMTIQDVALHLDVGWDLVKEIQRRYLVKKFSRPQLKRLKQIAIDEISIGKDHRYLTVVLDLLTGAVVFVGEGKGAEALAPFWQRLKCSGAKIAAVAIDMSPAYISAVAGNLPKATIVFDHFHIIKLFNEKLSDLRRNIYQKLNKAGQKVLKGTRWLLLKNSHRLRPKYQEKQRLAKGLRINTALATAYYLKEDLGQLWSQENKDQASLFLDSWIARASQSGVAMLNSFSKTLDRHRSGILAYYHFPITTGPLEGTNNKIKTLQKQAYGFRDMEFFKLKIYALHETRYALVG